MPEKKCREFGEIENRYGERRSSCVILPCNYVVEIRTELKAFKEYTQQALVLAAGAATDKYKDLNELRKEYTTDRKKDMEQFLKIETYNERVKFYDKYIEDTRTGHDILVGRVVKLEHDKATRENNEKLVEQNVDKKISAERFKTNRNLWVGGLVLTALNILIALLIHITPR